MRVDLLTREYPPEVYGGAGVHVEHLARELRRLADVRVHCFGAPRDEQGVTAYAEPAALAGANAALRVMGVDLEMARGSIAAILGRNGVGKTTTVKTIMGLVRPTSGSIRLDNDAITGWPPHRVARAGVAYVPEGRLIFPDLTVIENMVKAFQAIALSGSGGFKVVSQGIAAALVATAAGLLVAIYAIVAYNYFVSRVNGIGVQYKLYTEEFLFALGEYSAKARTEPPAQAPAPAAAATSG